MPTPSCLFCRRWCTILPSEVPSRYTDHQRTTPKHPYTSHSRRMLVKRGPPTWQSVSSGHARGQVGECCEIRRKNSTSWLWHAYHRWLWNL